MAVSEFWKHALIGGMLAAVIGPKAEAYIRNDKTLTEEQKKMIIGTAIGTVGGGFVGYHAGDKVIDGNIPDGPKKKIISTLVGAAGGGIAGYFIGEKIGYDENDAHKADISKKTAGETAGGR